MPEDFVAAGPMSDSSTYRCLGVRRFRFVKKTPAKKVTARRAPAR